MENEKVEKINKIEKVEAIIEAILFTMGNSVSIHSIASAIGHDEETTKKIIYNMMDRYHQDNRGIQIIEIDNAFQLCTKKEMYEYLIKVVKQPKKHVLTEVLLETLSIIAYKQPITKMEIEKIRGVKCDHAINKLVEYNLILEVGRLDAPGKPMLFGTTEDFLRNFGVQSIAELPVFDTEQMVELKIEARRNAVKAGCLIKYLFYSDQLKFKKHE